MKFIERNRDNLPNPDQHADDMFRAICRRSATFLTSSIFTIVARFLPGGMTGVDDSALRVTTTRYQGHGKSAAPLALDRASLWWSDLLRAPSDWIRSYRIVLPESPHAHALLLIIRSFSSSSPCPDSTTSLLRGTIRLPD